MKLLVDTHIMLWWLRDTPRLGPRVKALIADPGTELMVSTVSFWELSIKARLGKMQEPGSSLMDEARKARFQIVDLGKDHLAAFETLDILPGHKDAFDRLIVAQAIVEGAMLVTADRQLLAHDIRAFRPK